MTVFFSQKVLGSYQLEKNCFSVKAYKHMESTPLNPGLNFTPRLKTKKDWIEIWFIFSYFDIV